MDPPYVLIKYTIYLSFPMMLLRRYISKKMTENHLEDMLYCTPFPLI